MEYLIVREFCRCEIENILSKPMEDKEDYWGWKDKLISVPGFGYFPPKVNDELDTLTEVLTVKPSSLGTFSQ